jgi:tetratricopeptide (TPR) repeat protein
VPVYDVGVDGETCFIVSEFLEGGSLADRLAGQRPSREQAIRWIAEVADALEYAHLHGVVHLDIKPANILVDHHGRAKLADFGIAQSAAKSGEAGPSLGTLRYMSPEQLHGKPTDHRSDIFSLGVVLHEMLSGVVPYESLEPQTLRRDILAGSPKLSDRLEPSLRDVCRRALSRDPQARHASAAQFAAEIGRAAAPRGVARRSWLVPIVVLAVLAASGLIASQWLSRKPAPAGVGPLSSADLLAEATNLFFRHEHDEAEVRFTAYLEQMPDDVEALMRRGLSRTARGAFAVGVEDFTRALELKPRDATLHKHRAMALASLRQFEPAISDYETAISLDPSDRETRESFGACYSIMAAEKADRKEFTDAADLMTKAIAVYPHSPVFYHQRGSCLFHMGEYERALADLDEAIHREPRKPEHYENRGHCYQRLGRPEEAEREFKKAAELRTQ